MSYLILTLCVLVFAFCTTFLTVRCLRLESANKALSEKLTQAKAELLRASVKATSDLQEVGANLAAHLQKLDEDNLVLKAERDAAYSNLELVLNREEAKGLFDDVSVEVGRNGVHYEFNSNKVTSPDGTT